MRGRLLVAALAANMVLSLTALGWLAWISAAPRSWFPQAGSPTATWPSFFVTQLLCDEAHAAAQACAPVDRAGIG